MAFNKRDGLNALSSPNDVLDYTSYNQNTKARLAMAKVVADRLGGEGIYRLEGASSLSLISGVSVPPINLVVYDDSGEAWYFSTESNATITFNASSTADGRLYAVISLISPTPAGGEAAEGSYLDVDFTADDVAIAAPDHSILIGSGNIDSDPKFTTFTEQNVITFPPTGSTLFWTATADGITDQDIEDTETLFFEESDGISNSAFDDPALTDQKDLQIALNFDTNPGLMVSNNQLLVKAKSGLTVHLDADGIYRDITESGTFDFILSANSGTNQTISKNDNLSTLGVNSISTSTQTNGIELDLNLASDGGLTTSGGNLLVKLVGGGGISSGSSGLARSLDAFVLEASTGTTDAFNEDETIYVLGSNAIEIIAEDTRKLKFNLKLANITENGKESGLEVVNNKLKLAIDPQSHLVLGASGIYREQVLPNSNYGTPATGVHSQDDLYVDQSGALWLCTTAGYGDNAEWLQLSVGQSYESGSPGLPVANDFDTGNISHTYKIRAYDETLSNRGMVWLWFDYGRANDYDGGFWVSEDMFWMNWSPIDQWNSIEGSIYENVFDYSLYSSYKEFVLYLKNPYDGMFLDRTNFYIYNVDDSAYSFKVFFYHNYPDGWYEIPKTTLASNQKSKSIEAQGRGIRYNNVSLANQVLTATMASTASAFSMNANNNIISITSGVRYVFDPDGNLYDPT